jgi:hypothetical protein
VSDPAWRYEADDDWLASRRTRFFRRRRSRLFSAMSDAELGPFGGPRRNPQLKLTDKAYSTIRHAERQFTYTVIQVDLLHCRTCGHRLLEEHKLVVRTEQGVHRTVGRVLKCRKCDKEAWLFTSHMPSVIAGKARDAKAVL